jgi:hypothetical protein
MQRSADIAVRDTKFQLAESDRQRARLEEERETYEEQIQSLRQAMDVMVRLFFQRSSLSIHLTCYPDSKPKRVIFSLRNVGPSAKLQT